MGCNVAVVLACPKGYPEFVSQLVVSGLPSLLGPRRQCLLFEPVSGGDHVVQHVLHVASCECLPLLGCMVRVS